MAKKRTMLNASDAASINIDELLNDSTDGLIVIDSPITHGRKIKLRHRILSGEDILNKSKVLLKNQRIQDFLNETSLGPLIKQIGDNGQVQPAIGRSSEDADVCDVICGSRRRMSTYFAGRDFHILVSDDITDEEAEIISSTENTHALISLIERGYFWLECSKDNLNTRDIAQTIEKGKVSHTIVAAGIQGAKIDKNILQLYPSLNCIGRPTIGKLAKALAFKKGEESAVAKKIRSEHGELIDQIHSEFADDPDVSCAAITKLIIASCSPEVKTEVEDWAETIKTKTLNDGSLSSISFEKPLNVAQQEKLKTFLNKLIL